MLRKLFTYGGMLLLAGAITIATPGSARAQRGGGGHGGGGHFGGGHFGGAHFSGGHFGGAHFNGGHFGGTHIGGFHGGFQRGGYGYQHYYRPYYGSYGYSYPYYNSYPYVWPSPTYDSGYSGSYGDVAPYYADDTTAAAPPAGDYQAFYPPATLTAQSDAKAHVTVKAPADAQVWFDGTPTTATGPVRQYDSPPLTPGTRYGYEVRARWNENGREVRQTQQVGVTAGAHVEVDFPVAPKAAEKTSAAPQH